LRGITLSTPRPPSGGPVFYRGMELKERFAWTNLVLGSPVIGQRVWDILRCLDYLKTRQDVEGSQIRVLGRGPAGLAALMAGALDESVRSVLLDRTLATYASIVDAEDYAIALDWFVPGILQHFDIPDIAAAIYPRPVWITNALDGDGAVLSESVLRARYSQRISAGSIALKEFSVRTTVEDDKEVYIDWVKRS
jgi:Abhydrolase family